jgi:hypothetical protein
MTLATDKDILGLEMALDDPSARELIDLDAVKRVLDTLGAISRHSIKTIRADSNDRDEWAEDMAFVGKLARGH